MAAALLPALPAGKTPAGKTPAGRTPAGTATSGTATSGTATSGTTPASTPRSVLADAVRRVADAALEATVVGSWSRLGVAARRRLWGWDAPVPAGSLAGAEVLVTGGTRGIGREAATALAAAGASVGIVGRDLERARAAAAEIRRAAGTGAGDGDPGKVWAAGADLGSVAEVAALAEQVAERVAARTGRLDAVVHAAGLLSRSRRTSPDGTELTAAVHVVGPHLLTARLAPLLAAGAPSTVVWVSSGGMYLQRLDAAALARPPDPYRGSVAYARAKRAQVALAHLWGDRLAGDGVACVAVHPGWADTAALRDGLPRFAAILGPLLRSPAEGADTVAWLAAGRAGPHPVPALWLDRRPRGEHRWPGTAAAPGEAERLWAWCEERTGGAGAAALAALAAVPAVPDLSGRGRAGR